MTTIQDRCQKQVWDRDSHWGSHQCSRRGVVERDGSLYCKQHDPEVVRARSAERDAAAAAKEAAKMSSKEAAAKLAARLGAGFPLYNAYSDSYSGSIVLSKDEVLALIERLEAKRD